MQSECPESTSVVLERCLVTRLLMQRVSESELDRFYLAPASLLPTRASSLRSLLYLPGVSIELCSFVLILLWSGGGLLSRDREIVEPKNDTSIDANATK
jgi:hypothetical protein